MWFELLINLRQVSFKCIWKLNMSYDCNISNTYDISMRFWKCFKYSEILNTLDFTESQHSRSGRSSYLGNWTCLMIVISLTLMIFQWGFGNLCYDEYRGDICLIFTKVWLWTLNNISENLWTCILTCCKFSEDLIVQSNTWMQTCGWRVHEIDPWWIGFVFNLNFHK